MKISPYHPHEVRSSLGNCATCWGAAWHTGDCWERADTCKCHPKSKKKKKKAKAKAKKKKKKVKATVKTLTHNWQINMSMVTNVIVSIECATPSEHIDAVNQWLLDQNSPPLDLIDGDSGGNKNLEVTLLIGAYNYFNITGYVKYLKTLNIGDITLMVQGQDDDHFRAICFEGR